MREIYYVDFLGPDYSKRILHGKLNLILWGNYIYLYTPHAQITTVEGLHEF